MKRRFVVKWYEFNLTKVKYRKFFTEIGAEFFKWYLLYFKGAIAKIYEI